MQQTKVALIIAAVLCAAPLSGCGSSDSGTTSTATDTAPAVDDSTSPGDSAGSGDAASTSATATPTPTAGTSPDGSTGGVSIDGSGGSDGSSQGQSAGSDSGTPACTSAGLKVSLDFGGGSGAAGSQNGTLVFRNTSTKTCSLLGFPGVSYVDDAGHQLGASASRDGAAAPRVTLQADDAAGAQISLANVQNYDKSVCDPADASGLRVYPPGERAAVFVPFTSKACNKIVHTIGVQAIRSDG